MSCMYELLEAVALHHGLKEVVVKRRQTDLSSVRPELLAKAFSKMEDLKLWGTKLSVDQLNWLFTNLAGWWKQVNSKGKARITGKQPFIY